MLALSLRGLLLLCIVVSSGAGTLAADLRKPTPRHVLRAAQTWHLDPPDGARFDASALLIQPDGSLLTVNDKVPGIFLIGFGKDGAARLTAMPGALTPAQLAPFASAKHGPYDCEGLARDDDGRIYICEEGDRWILRFDPKAGSVERLPIDWSPVKRWFSSDRNASFEGIAVGGGVLFVANEREVGRIITVDLATMKVADSFQVTPIGNPARDAHYTDLCWTAGELWVLCRDSRCVLRVDPRTRRVLAQFDYLELETSRQNAYAHPYPYGFVEGLAVDAENIWLMVDNNGFPRVADADDRRPTLWRCLRPDRSVPKK